MADSSATIPADAKPIPGFDGRYLITPGGEVWSTKWGGPRKMKLEAAPGGTRVCLWRNGERYRPNVNTLIRRVFGDDKPAMSDAKLRAELLEEYGAGSDAVAWFDSL